MTTLEELKILQQQNDELAEETAEFFADMPKEKVFEILSSSIFDVYRNNMHELIEFSCSLLSTVMLKSLQNTESFKIHDIDHILETVKRSVIATNDEINKLEETDGKIVRRFRTSDEAQGVYPLDYFDTDAEGVQ